MKYLDFYPHCEGCPVEEYCGTVIGSIRLCNSCPDDYKKTKQNERES